MCLIFGFVFLRGFDWMMEGEMVTMDTSEQQWQQYMNEGSIYNTSTNPSIFEQSYGDEAMNLLSLPEIGGTSSQNDEYNLFINQYEQPPRDFIDAWSNDNNLNTEQNNSEPSSVPPANGNLSPSSLNLSMAMAVGNSLDEEIGQIQMGLGPLGGGGRDASYHHKPQVSSWLSPVQWMGSSSTPGGPLAEVLRPSNVAVCSNQGSDGISPPGTSSSSPSGVLQRTMLSLSDSSVCNSPTLAATATPSAAPEVLGFQWLS